MGLPLVVGEDGGARPFDATQLRSSLAQKGYDAATVKSVIGRVQAELSASTAARIPSQQVTEIVNRALLALPHPVPRPPVPHVDPAVAALGQALAVASKTMRAAGAQLIASPSSAGLRQAAATLLGLDAALSPLAAGSGRDFARNAELSSLMSRVADSIDEASQAAGAAAALALVRLIDVPDLAATGGVGSPLVALRAAVLLLRNAWGQVGFIFGAAAAQRPMVLASSRYAPGVLETLRAAMAPVGEQPYARALTDVGAAFAAIAAALDEGGRWGLALALSRLGLCPDTCTLNARQPCGPESITLTGWAQGDGDEEDGQIALTIVEIADLIDIAHSASEGEVNPTTGAGDQSIEEARELLRQVTARWESFHAAGVKVHLVVGWEQCVSVRCWLLFHRNVWQHQTKGCLVSPPDNFVAGIGPAELWAPGIDFSNVAVAQAIADAAASCCK